MTTYTTNGIDTQKQVFFYEHDFYVLSNFSAFEIIFEGILHKTSEHAYQYSKFNDVYDDFPDEAWKWDPIRNKIRNARSAHIAYKLAQDHASLQRPDWNEIKLGVMKNILRSKVSQHKYVRDKLKATGDRELIEDSWRDDFWGWGPNRDGKNWLGVLWMQVRDELTNNTINLIT